MCQENNIPEARDADSGRFDSIESKLAHLELTVQQLSDVLYRQQREFAALSERQQRLLARMASLGSEGMDEDLDANDPRRDVPPHY